MKTLLLILFVIVMICGGCSHKEGYAEILDKWQEQQNNAQITELQHQLNDANSKLAKCEAENKKAGGVFTDLHSSIETKNKEINQLRKELANSPSVDDVTAVLESNQQVIKQYNEVATKYNDLLPMWQQLKKDYQELAVALRGVVASSNISANVTQEYLNLIKPVD